MKDAGLLSAEEEGLAVAEDFFGAVGVAALGFVQGEGFAGGCGEERVFAGAQDDAARRVEFFRGEGDDEDFAEGLLKTGEDFFLPVGAVDEGEAARRFEGLGGGFDPEAQVAVFFRIGGAFDFIGRRVVTGFFVKRRVHDDLVEDIVPLGGKVARICDLGFEIFGESWVTGDVAQADFDQVLLDINADAGNAFDAAGEAEHGAADAAAEIEDAVAADRRTGGGKEDGIDRDAVAGGGLFDLDAAVEEAVDGGGQLSHGGSISCLARSGAVGKRSTAHG